MFKISLENFFKTKFHIYLKLHIQPSELENLEYYEFYYLVKDLIANIKEENKQNQGQNDATSGAMGGMKMPNLKVPTIKMPKM